MFKSKDAIYNFIYSIGAAIVILGALFKLTHTSLFGLSGNVILSIGLVTEAIIFVIFAFDPPKVEEGYAWENVYPELLDKNAKPNPKHSTAIQAADVKEVEISLSTKLDQLLADAKLDVALFDRLRTGIDKFSSSVDQINKSVDVSASTSKYGEELNKAAAHIENLNALYALQLENGKAAADYQTKYVSDLQKSAQQSEKFNSELEGLTSNLNNLNRVYGGMLNAMKA